MAMKHDMMDDSGPMQSSTLGVDRTSATVKGGRRFSFGALVVVGDRQGKVGFGYGKSNEVPAAVEKAEKYAKRTLVTLPLVGTTIPHQVEGKFASAKVRLIPASPGTGVVAGGTVRTILERAGVQDCLTKCFGSTNKRNVVKAVFDGLEKLRPAATVASLRGQNLGATEIEEKIERSKRFMPATTAKGQKAKGPVNTVDQERRGGAGRRRPRRGAEGGDQGGSPAAAAPATEAPKA